MKIIKNKLSNVGRAPMDIDNLNSLPFIPEAPLPPKNFAMMLVGSPGSGKTNLFLQMFSFSLVSKKYEK